MTWHNAFVLLAIIFGVLATAGVPAHPRFSFLAASLTCGWVAIFLLP